MQSGLALFLVLVGVGLVTCMPAESLRERLQALRSLKGDKLGDGEKSGNRSEKMEPKWPYGWIEFNSLIGKCETARNWIDILDLGDLPPGDGVLVEACPKAYEAGAHMANATEQELKEAGRFLDKIFPLLQCVNLHAEKEELEIALMVAQKDVADDLYMQESAVLFGICDKVFETYDNEVKELDDDLEKVETVVESKEEETVEVEDERETRIKALIRQLINTAAKKR